ncbi:hypothetical protein [Rhodococcus phage RGL3]|uniref:Uncharacterized protein n=1 Tax=Rhodococcus phage RGL3 TaxID=2922221 RepID=G9FHL3_9CAUD|nr:virion structural protein [Rhodococcus phage RGL3]AEV52101.1 hypothetical protein [Rhodococcus phage RGL3]
MSAHEWNGGAWTRAKELGFVDPTDGWMRDVKEAHLWDGTKFVRVYVKAQTVRDEFNRANGDLGTDWNAAVMSNPPTQIYSNAAHAADVNDNTGRQAASWVQRTTPLNRNQMYVKAQLTTSRWGNATNNYTTLFLGGHYAFGNGVFCYLSCSTGSSSYITTCNTLPNGAGNSATGGSNQTQRASGASISATDLIEFRRTRNFTTGIYTYTGYRNGSSFISWTDSTGIVPVGETRRSWGFCIESNDQIFQIQYSSPGIDWIEAGDL